MTKAPRLQLSGRARGVALVALLAAVAASAAATDWPQFRGPDHDGAAAAGALDREPIGLEILWTRPLGSGYSAISVAGEIGVTLFSDGTDDLAVAFDAATGEERWRYRIGETYKGHSGSDDGPISTPAIAGDAVYGLGPRGHLFAVRLADGGEIWTHAFGDGDSRAPYYGYATAPLVVGDLVVVQPGGDAGHSITAFDRATGVIRWSLEDDAVSYQSPTVVELGGRRQVVAVNDKFLLGIAPEDGGVLWKHEHGMLAAELFAQPLAIGGDRLVLNSLEDAVALAVTSDGGGFAVEELWRSKAFKGAYALPVFHQGHLYGLSSRFLTCLDAATGELTWRSRPPGTNGMILVDGQLVMMALDGDVVVAAASSEGYQERTRTAVFENGGLTPPSFAGGRFFVRNLEQMAAVGITDQATASAAVAAAAPRQLLGEFGDFVRRVEAADDKAALVDEFFEQHPSLPIVEDGGLVHFVYRGPAEDVAVSGNFLRWNEDLVFDRIAGTDVHFRSLELDPEAVWEYAFQVDFGDPMPDPANPETVRSFFGPPFSLLRMPGAADPDYLVKGDAPAGRLDSFQFRSEIAGNERRIQLYLPADYAAASDRRYPLLVVLHGNLALEAGHLDVALDNLIAGGRVAPMIAVFVPPASYTEYVPPELDALVRMLAEELLPHLDRHYRTVDDPASRAVLGILDGGVAGLYAALSGETFGRVALQSAATYPPVMEKLGELIPGAAGRPVRIVVEQRRHDFKFGDAIDAVATTRELIESLGAAGLATEVLGVPGNWGWGSWNAHLDRLLPELLPPPPPVEE
jgi:enterochelin esterase-like enzyme/outer membrane protein assembly factor BamB